MILSVCIALFITNGSQSDLLSCPPRAAETQALLGSSSRAATTLLTGRGKGNLDQENHILGSSDPQNPARMWDLCSYLKGLCTRKRSLSIYLGGTKEETLTLARFGPEAPGKSSGSSLKPDPSLAAPHRTHVPLRKRSWCSPWPPGLSHHPWSSRKKTWKRVSPALLVERRSDSKTRGVFL